MSSDLREAATKARRLANGSNLDAYRESLTDLGRAYLKAYPTAAALSVQGEPADPTVLVDGRDESLSAIRAVRDNPETALHLLRRLQVRLDAALAAPAVPPDWKPVPVEPTMEMLDTLRANTTPCLPTRYRALLAAAPSAPGADTAA